MRVYIFLYSLCLFWVFSCNKNTKEVIIETNLLSDTYEGFRLTYINLSSQQDKENVHISGTLVNTGRNKVTLPLKPSQRLLINFDQSLKKEQLTNLSLPIKKELLKKAVSLEPGQIASNVSVKVNGKKEKSTPHTTTDKEDDLPFEDFCPDLQIDTFFVSKRTKKYAQIEFKIVNIGKGPAYIYGKTTDLEDNVAIRAYASGTKRLSRGDIILGGTYIDKELKQQKGVLQPSTSVEGSFRIDIRKKTRHMPYIIISIDDYQQLWECEERNNVKELLY